MKNDPDLVYLREKREGHHSSITNIARPSSGYFLELIGEVLHGGLANVAAVSVAVLLAAGALNLQSCVTAILFDNFTRALYIIAVTALPSAYLWGSLSDWRKGRGNISEEIWEEIASSEVPFLQRGVSFRQHHQLPGTKVWQPCIDLVYVRKRGICTVGESLTAAMLDSLTWALEWKVQALGRLLAYDLGLGRRHVTKDRNHTPEKLYKGLINCSTSCYIQKDSGNLVMYDTILPRGRKGLQKYHKITLELDHCKKQCLRAIIQRTEDPVEGEIFLVDEPIEVGSIAYLLLSIKSHPLVHWFANGIADLSPKYQSNTSRFTWDLANRSCEITQALNVAAVFSAPPLMFVTEKNLSEMICHNVVAEGLPHHAASIPKAVREQSLTHQMMSLARKALNRQIGIPPAHTESILAATIMHSADHYYCDLYFGHDCRSTFLGADFTSFRTTLIAPNQYRTRKLLCKQHLDDSICKVLYESCHSVDPAFADSALFLGVAT